MIEGSRSMRDLLREGDWLNSKRVIGWSGILLTLEVLVFAFFVAGTHGRIVKLEKPTTTDFVSFYAAGILANADRPALVYSQPDHYAAEQDATEPGIDYNFFFYPPIFLLFCSVLARLPYLLAFVVFEAVSCLLYIFVIGRILRQPGWTWLVSLMAFPSVLWTLGLGQNSFLTAAIFGTATLLLDTRPLMAGAAFGLLCYKPHFGLLVPLALGAGRHWKAFATAGLSAAFLIGLSGLCFGWDTWRAFLVTFSDGGAVFAGGRIPFAGLISVFGAARLAGLSIEAAYIIQGTVTLGAAVSVGMIWYWGCSAPVRFASLAAGTLLAIPVVLFYDFVLLSVAGCWLIRAGLEGGFLNWEKTLLSGTFLVPILSRSVGLSLHVPIGPSAAVAVLVLCVAQARCERRPRSQAVH
jgi:alpha-1,2-mannosyltransferase